MALGMKYVTPKLESLVARARELARADGSIGVHCWRGGLRSGAVAWLLRQHGLHAVSLAGGYKAFRAWALSTTKPTPEDPWWITYAPQEGDDVVYVAEAHRKAADLLTPDVVYGADNLAPWQKDASTSVAARLLLGGAAALRCRVASITYAMPERETPARGIVAVTTALAALCHQHRQLGLEKWPRAGGGSCCGISTCAPSPMDGAEVPQTIFCFPPCCTPHAPRP